MKWKHSVEHQTILVWGTRGSESEDNDVLLLPVTRTQAEADTQSFMAAGF